VAETINKTSMKRIEKPSTYFKWNGQLAEVIGIAQDKTIEFKIVGGEPCPHCGNPVDFIHSEVESSPNFQQAAESINTLIE
jgi:hypothetical protein